MRQRYTKQQHRNGLAARVGARSVYVLHLASAGFFVSSVRILGVSRPSRLGGAFSVISLFGNTFPRCKHTHTTNSLTSIHVFYELHRHSHTPALPHHTTLPHYNIVRHPKTTTTTFAIGIRDSKQAYMISAKRRCRYKNAGPQCTEWRGK